MQMLKRVYQGAVIVFVVWIIYSAFIFGYNTDRESANWGVTGGKLEKTIELENKDIKRIVNKISGNTDIMFITPKLSTGSGGKVVSFVDIYEKTSIYYTKIMWITSGEKNYKPQNMRTTFFPYVKGRYTFIVHGDLKQLKFGPEKTKKGENFKIKKVIIKKYRFNK